MVQTAVFSGSALGPLIGGILADWLGYRTTFVISGSMAFVAGVITLLVVEENFVRPTAAEKAKRSGESTWRFVLGPTLLALTMSMLLVRFASSAVQPITPIFVQMISHTTAAVNTLSGLTLGVLGVTSAISSIYLGKLGDKKGHFRILLWCSIGAGLIYLPMAAAQHPWHLIVLQAIFGLFAGGLIPAANALIAHHTDDARRGVVFGFMNTAGSVGGFAGPLAGAALATSFGIRATFVLTGVVLLLMALALWINNRRRPMEASPDPT
jgi:DHA1 family multidrug resistance protein-like MFS transporter